MITDNRLRIAKQKAKQKFEQYKNDKQYGKLIKSCYLSICHTKDEWNLCSSIAVMNSVLKEYFNDTNYI